MRKHATNVLRAALLIAAYVAAARLGLALDAVGGFATLVWAPTGIALAALLTLGLGFWPGVFIAAFAANFWNGAALPVALAIALGNTLEAVVGAVALKRLGFRNQLDGLRDVALLVSVAALGSTLISASVGAGSLLLGGTIASQALAETWRAWWLGDLIGALIVAPLLLAWFGSCADPRTSTTTLPWSQLSSRRRLEALALSLLTLGTGQLVFASENGGIVGAFRQPFMLFIPLLWAALRFGVRGATTGTAVASALAIYGTAQGLGPFVRPVLHESLAHLQVFMGISVVITLTLCASMEERRRARAAQERDHQLLRAIAEGTSDCVFVKDTVGRYALINDAAASFLGLPREAVLGKSDLELFPEATARTLMQRDQEIMDAGEARTCEEEVEKGGVRHTFLSTKAPCRDEHGGVIGTLGVCRDISERKLREDAQELLADLAPVLAQTLEEGLAFARIAELVVERKLAERCTFELADPARETHAHPAELAGMQYQRAFALEVRGYLLGSMSLQASAPFTRRMDELAQEVARRVSVAMESARLYRLACEAIRVRDEFLSIASHELRTPLHSLVLNLSHVAATAPAGAGDTRGRIERALRQTDRLARLVDSLLDVSQVTAGQLQLHREELDLAELCQEVCGRFADQAAARGASIELRSQGGASGQWDRLRIEQVLTNLLSNALKYGAGQPVIVTIESDPESVRVCVRDHGMGIGEEDLPRLFERYQRAASARRFGGLGLGLFIAREIVTAHGGAIAVESSRGLGASFTVRLPKKPPTPELQAALEPPLARVRGQLPS